MTKVFIRIIAVLIVQTLLVDMATASVWTTSRPGVLPEQINSSCFTQQALSSQTLEVINTLLNPKPKSNLFKDLAPKWEDAIPRSRAWKWTIRHVRENGKFVLFGLGVIASVSGIFLQPFTLTWGVTTLAALIIWKIALWNLFRPTMEKWQLRSYYLVVMIPSIIAGVHYLPPMAINILGYTFYSIIFLALTKRVGLVIRTGRLFSDATDFKEAIRSPFKGFHLFMTLVAFFVVGILDGDIILYRSLSHTTGLPYFQLLDWFPDFTAPSFVMTFAYVWSSVERSKAQWRLAPWLPILIPAVFNLVEIGLPLVDRNPLFVGFTLDWKDLFANWLAGWLTYEFHVLFRDRDRKHLKQMQDCHSRLFDGA